MRIWNVRIQIRQLNKRYLSHSGRGTLRVGNVSKTLHNSENQYLVPSSGRDINSLPQSLLAHIKWMLQKDIARQDVFLIGHPGPTRRRLASLYCELANREAEYLVLSRDTTEGDIKQRREISAGSSQYLPGPAVRAACEGRALIIEGIERAEQNLLPILNNLLENREMHLEDGRFLVAHQRYDSLLHPSTDLVRVHPDFWVIALGVPVPPYRGYPLDPPLRSRFQARIVEDLTYEEHKQLLANSSGSDEKAVHSLLSFASFFKESEAKTWPYLSSSAVDSLHSILLNVPTADPSKLVNTVYPYNLLLQPDTRSQFEVMLSDLGITSPRSVLGDPVCKVQEIKDGIATIKCGRHQFTVPAGNETAGSRSDNPYISTPTQEGIISNMILSHSVSDICIVGPPGCGKSVVINEFARRLGYQTDSIVLYNDMTSRDLLQQRQTDSKGNTVWENAPLVHAALSAKLFVLDSAHKLHHTTLSTLASLCQDRVLVLPDGKRLISHSAHQDMCASLNLTSEQLRERGVLPIHPSFRIIATGEETGDWITPEVLGLWHYHHHSSLRLDQQLNLLSKICPQTSKVHIKRIQTMSEKLRSHTDPVLAGVGNMLTMRRLIAICRAVANGADLGNAVHTSLLTRFMPALTRKTLTATLKDIGIVETSKVDDVTITSDENTLTIGSVCVPKLGGEKELVPDTLFYDNKNQLNLLEELLRSFGDGSHILLVGNQGVGKNKLIDRLLGLLEGSREYLQLHRDSTVQSITVQPTITGGRVEYADSALVRAVRNGRVLVVDEADKAPTNVTSVLRTLLDTGAMWLSDGRRIVPPHTPTENLTDKDIPCHSGFRAIFLANRPGFPFLGNDFFSVMGDLLSCHAIDNPDPDSELALLKQYGPDVPEETLLKLIGSFSELRAMSDAGTFLYPYSTRELVNIIKHLQAYPEDGITAALSNVLDFEQQQGDIWEMVVSILHKHGIPFGARPVSNVSPRYPLKRPFMVGTLIPRSDETHACKISNGSFRERGPWFLPHYNADAPVSLERAKTFNECVNSRYLPRPRAQTKFTHLLSGGEDGTIHAISSAPHVIHTVQNDSQEVKCLDIGPALGFKPDLSAVAWNQYVIASDTSSGTLLKFDTEKRTVHRLDLNRVSYFKPKKVGGFKVTAGKGGKCWIFLDDLLIKHNIANNKTKECELPFEISAVHQSHLNPVDDELMVCSKDGVWYFAKFSENEVTCYALTSEIDFNGNWVLDQAAGVKTDTPYSSDVIQSQEGVLMAENCFGLLGNRNQVKLRNLDTGIIESGVGLLNRGVLLTPVKAIPEAYRSDEQTDKHTNGFLAVVDTVRYSISFVPLQAPADKSRYDSPLDIKTALSGRDKIHTLTAGGVLQGWELTDERLAVSYETWRSMVGEPSSQLNIDRYSGEDVSAPKHGKIDPDNIPHVGGNTWAGGTGGRDTAGLGGKGGPYRLDAGHNVHQLSDEEKNSVPEEVQKAAREMGKRAFKKRLEEIKMSEYDAQRYDSFVSSVSKQITSLKQLAAGLEAKQGDRVWLKNQTDGELDDAKLVEGLTGERNVYKRRGLPEEKGLNMTKPKHLTLLVDVSGSMYRFNGLDQRLQRELELMAMVMEGLQGSDNRVRYDIIGHSGEDPHIPFVNRDIPPDNEKKRLDVLEEMHAHSQFCWSGDHTVDALNQAIQHAASIEADDRIVIAFSDANLKRYFINPNKIASIMTKDPSVSVFMILIGSLGDEAEQLRRVLPAGKSFVTMDTKEMPTILQQIFTSTMIQ
ncbi:hypothetical protein ACHWQZ_G011506 [Mnemiopsis leidyi]